MSQQSHPARLDQLAHGVFRRLLNQYGNPVMKAACNVFSREVEACFEENLGPHTGLGKIADRIAKAGGER